MPAMIEPLAIPVYPGVAEPWPGPQPYNLARRDVFCGRDADLGRLLGFLSAHRLMLLLAKSGVGKTSLLQAGILPELLDDRRDAPRQCPLPLLVREWWEGSPPPRTVRAAFRNAVWKSIQETIRPGGLLDAQDSEQVAQSLRGRVGNDLQAYEGDGIDLLLSAFEAAGSLVVIIDQFEELLRVPRTAGDEDAVGIVSRLYQASERRPSSIRIVLSLRQEFESELRALESVPSVGGLRQRSFFLNTLRASGLRDAIERPAEAVGWRFEPTLLDALLAWIEMPGPWLGAEADDHEIRGDWGEPLGGARLLGLQALLKRLYDVLGNNAGGEAPTLVGSSDVQQALELADDELRVERWVERALELHITHAFEVWAPTVVELATVDSAGVDADSAKLLGRRAAALMAPHLYNEAGHKIPRRRGYLNHVAREQREMDGDGPDEEVVLSGIARSRQWRGNLLRHVLDHVAELVLKHLSSNSINLLKSYGGDSAYELVHDGLGRPFVRWAERERKRMEFSLAAPYALRGASFHWQPRSGVQRHLTWNGCEFIRLDFVDVEFAECDLAGCFFVGCTFRRTRFTERTSLNGAVFRNCRFVVDGANPQLDHVEGRSILLDGCLVDGLEIQNSILEGATFRNCEITGTVLVEDSHVLLAQFSGLSGEGVITLRSCDVAYCRMEPFRTRGERARVVLEGEGETCALLPRTSRHWEDEPSWEHAVL